MSDQVDKTIAGLISEADEFVHDSMGYEMGEDAPQGMWDAQIAIAKALIADSSYPTSVEAREQGGRRCK